MGCQHGRGVAADGEERAVPKRHLSGVAHHQTQANHDDGVVKRHGELRQAEFPSRRPQDRLHRNQREREEDEGKEFLRR